MPSIRTSLGCMLVEALVACCLSACALAATLMLQARALAATHAAREFSVAALQAASMAALVQANAAGWRQAPARTAAPAVPTADCTQRPCDAAQRAAFDAARWRRALAWALHGGRGDVRCGEWLCTVAVGWSRRTLRQQVPIDSARQPAVPVRSVARTRCTGATAGCRR